MTEHIAARNLQFAERARLWVRQQARITAANRSEEHVFPLFTKGLVEASRRITQPGEYGERWLQKSAGIAEFWSFGNCGEMSAMVYRYLRPMIRPVSLIEVQFRPGSVESNHGFIVIGRSLASVSRDLRTWNAECAVCDSWSDKAYLLRDIEQQMPECDFNQGASVRMEIR